MASRRKMTTTDGAHVWVIDAIEGHVARVEEDGERMLSVPTHLLPSGAAEGDVFRVRRERSATGMTVHVEADPAAARAAKTASKRQVDAIAAESKKRDRGGDVAL